MRVNIILSFIFARLNLIRRMYYTRKLENAIITGLSKGNYLAITDIAPIVTLVISPVKSGWSVKSGIPNIEL